MTLEIPLKRRDDRAPAHSASARMNRRGFIMNSVVSVASIASAAAVAAPAGIPNVVDPIFAAIEEHRGLCDKLDKLLTRFGAIEFKKPKDDPKHIRLRRQCDKAHDACSEAEHDLCALKPLTAAGVIAIMNYAVEYVWSGGEWLPVGPARLTPWENRLLETLAAALSDLRAQA